MGDVALSAVPSPLAALLSGGSSDSAGTSATASQGADPFAALLASATVIKNADTLAGTKAADAVALLLATAAPATPIAPTPIALAIKAPAAPALPIATEDSPVESDAAIAAFGTKSGDDEPETESDSKNDGGDPLADAIASGATAVLAFIPVIAAPVQMQDPAPVSTQVPIDAPIALRQLKFAPVPTGPAQARHAAAQTQADQAATQDQTDSDAAQADAQTARQQTPATDAKPATTQLSPETAKAVAAAFDQADTEAAIVAPSDTTADAIAAEAAKIQLPQQAKTPQPMAAEQAQHPVAPIQPAPARRRGEEVAAPRRAGDTRKRTDITPTDAASAGLAQRVSDNAQPTIARPVTDVHAKGDTIVEQTLTIARDGAWLDKLAHDIASAGSGNDLHFKLEPQNLGALSVAIRQNDDGASIRLTADTQTTRDILVDAQPKLMAEARAHGLKVSDTQIDVRQDHSQNQGTNQDTQRWAQQQAGQNGTSQNGQNRQSSPGHQPFVSNLARKTESDSESPNRDSDARYA